MPLVKIEENKDLMAKCWPNGQNERKGSLWDILKVGVSPMKKQIWGAKFEFSKSSSVIKIVYPNILYAIYGF